MIHKDELLEHLTEEQIETAQELLGTIKMAEWQGQPITACALWLGHYERLNRNALAATLATKSELDL